MRTRRNGIVIETGIKRVNTGNKRANFVYEKGIRVERQVYPKFKKVLYVEMKRKYDNSWVHIQSDKKAYIKQLRKEGYRKVGVWHAEVPA